MKKNIITILLSLYTTVVAYTQTPINGAIIQGSGVSVSGTGTSAIGLNTQASGNYSFSFGNGTKSLGLYSMAGGWNSQAEGSVSFAFGNFSFAKSANAVALGANAQAYQPYTVAIGNNTVAGMYASPFSGTNAICLGNQSEALGDYSLALGQYVKAGGSNSMAIGKGYSSTQFLVNNTANTIALGMGSTVPTLFIKSATGSATATGTVGIGTTLIGSKLQVNGNVAIGYSGSTAAPANGLAIAGNVGIGTANALARINIAGTNDQLIRFDKTEAGAHDWSIGASSLGTQSYFTIKGGADGTNLSSMFTVNSNGKVGIGVDDFGGDYKFAVKGKILAEGVNVELFDRWPDYVFEKDYKLLSITEVADFIKQHGHLPEIPNATEMQKNGMDLGAMNILLTKKIEEMMLYIIELKNENEAIKAKLDNIK